MTDFSHRMTPTQGKELGGFLVVIGVGLGANGINGINGGDGGSIQTLTRRIKLADGLMRGAKAIHKLGSPTPSNLFSFALTAAKALAKGASKGHIMKGKSASDNLKRISKGLKASEGALNLVKYGSVLDPEGTDPWESVIKGYKMCNSVFNLFDGVNGVCPFGATEYGAIKGGLDGVGVAVKALVLSKEMYGLLVQGFGISHRVFTGFLKEFDDKEEENLQKALKVLVRELGNREEEKKEEKPRWDLDLDGVVSPGCLRWR